MARLVSKVYGEALYNFATENNQLEKMYEEALDIIEVFSTDASVSDFLLNPNFSENDKIDFLRVVFIDKLWSSPIAKIFKFFHINIGKGQDPKILDFLALIIKKGRQKEIVPILRHFAHLVLEEKNVGEADIVSVKELNDKQKSKLKDKLIASTKYSDFIINYTIDESLIAGLKIKIDDKVFDTTYKTKLFDISKSLRGLKLWLI